MLTSKARSFQSDLIDLERRFAKEENEIKSTNKVKVNNDDDHWAYGHVL